MPFALDGVDCTAYLENKIYINGQIDCSLLWMTGGYDL